MTAVLFPMLFFRVALFAGFQGVVALVFLAIGTADPWYESQAYWIITGLMANLVTLSVLARLSSRNGRTYLDHFRFHRATWRRDVLMALGLVALAAPISMLPNVFLAEQLLGSPDTASELFYRPLPVVIILIGFLWPLTQGLVELPFYFWYLMPRLEKRLKNGWVAWVIASFFLALQHTTLPLIFNAEFIAWRFGMFLPFALFVGLCIKLRPRLLPYLMISHALIDFVAVIMLLTVPQAA
jgi:membrane protease YdiL (CAAX protease family)